MRERGREFGFRGQTAVVIEQFLQASCFRHVLDQEDLAGFIRQRFGRDVYAAPVAEGNVVTVVPLRFEHAVHDVDPALSRLDCSEQVARGGVELGDATGTVEHDDTGRQSCEQVRETTREDFLLAQLLQFCGARAVQFRGEFRYLAFECLVELGEF